MNAPLLMTPKQAARYPRPPIDSQWWRERGPFIRLGEHAHVTDDDWEALDGWYGEKLVYFMRSDISGLIKIGVSTDPFRRAYDLGPWVRVIAVEAGGRARERWLHNQFAEFCLAAHPDRASFTEWMVHGTEWFFPGAPLLEYLGPEPLAPAA